MSANDPDDRYDVDNAGSMTTRMLKVLKHDDMFAVLDDAGNCGRQKDSPEGLFFKDTRYLSKWDLRCNGGVAPLLVSSMHDDDGSALTATLANPTSDGIAKDLIGITRTKFIWSGCCYERLSLRNYDVSEHRFPIDILFQADFKDLFEVRGTQRAVARPCSACRIDQDGIVFEYVGLDNISRKTRVTFRPEPELLSAAGRASFKVTLPPGGTTSIVTRVQCMDTTSPASDMSIVAAYRARRRDVHRKTGHMATVVSNNAVFNDLMCRCTSDVYMLLARTPRGYYPHAGIPWYSTVFGRDGILTALFTLWVDPAIAKGVLLLLAATQARDHDPASDAAPGKILHELRQCEMANTAEIPFGRYYGTVDATPLFVVLAGEYLRRTGDHATIREIWPNIQAALAWCERDGDRDGDGFVEYYRATPEGLANQGWKDSHDAIFHADGRMAEGPIALVEVQAYVHQAYLSGSCIALANGDKDAARCYASRAEKLREKFHDAFWLDDCGTYALALDGAKKPCRVLASNAGHALLSELVPTDAAFKVGRTLMGTAMWSGWGVRTLATSMPRYNPMSYHNGSIWPHDNALVAMGLARFGMKREAARIFEGLYTAQSYHPENRLPELFCGSPRRRGRGFVSYPVSCSPQAWAAAAPFALLSACLGLEIDSAANSLTLRQPILPVMTSELQISRVQVGDGMVDIRLMQTSGGVAVDVLRRTGGVGVSVIS